MQMSNRIDAARLLPIVMGVALGSALLAALALLLSGRTAGDLVRKREQTAELAALSQNMPLQAGAAVRGSAPAFDALADSRLRLTRVLEESGLAQGSGKNAAGWTAMLEQSQSVLDGREAALKAQQAAAAVRELTPQLLTALANTVKAFDPPRPAAAPQFERFELRAQAVDQDLSALADGTAPVEAASRRLTDSLEYMGASRPRSPASATRSTSRPRRPPRRAPFACFPPCSRTSRARCTE
jgi:hypothetical protein